MRKKIGWNPKRVLFGLSRIGYTPHSAIADIVDNSVSYGAKNVNIIIRKEREDLADSRKNNIKEYVIVDDGWGMDGEGILKALELGSGDVDDYSKDSLSKFGLGLKSASFSQGNKLEVISSTGEDGFKKYSVDLSKIEDEYFCEELKLNDSDIQLISKFLDKSGTIVRIADIHKSNHPSLKKTTGELFYRLGTIYYYFLIGDLKIFLNGDEVEPYDVLFSDEAENQPRLDENEWDGKTVNWIKKPETQTLDIDCEPPVKAVIEVTQLPHPPTFSLEGESEQKNIREKYKINAQNYGFYVYRNKRLISWASRFDGIIPQDQDFYAFRGRILLDSSADDSFNIDVKKSHLTLSDEAHDALSDLADEYKRKSKKAWQRASDLKKQKSGNQPNSVSNEIASSLEMPDSLPGEGIPTPEEEKKRKEREQDYQQKIKERVKKEAEEQKKIETGDSSEVTDEEVRQFATESTTDESSDKRILRVSNVADNLLWEPYFDDELGYCVRINKLHRFSKMVFEDNYNNVDVQVLYEIIMLHFVIAEAKLYKNPDFDTDHTIEILNEYRHLVSDLLLNLMRRKNIKLPPIE